MTALSAPRLGELDKTDPGANATNNANARMDIMWFGNLLLSLGRVPDDEIMVIAVCDENGQ